MEDWANNTYDEMLDKCVETVEYNEMISECLELMKEKNVITQILNEEIFNDKILNDDECIVSIDNITTEQNNSVQMDFTRIKEILYHFENLISDTDHYMDKIKEQLSELQKVASTCEQHEQEYFLNVESGDTRLRGVVHNARRVISKGANTLVYIPNTATYILNKENYQQIEISLNRMGGMISNLIYESEEIDENIKEISKEAYISKCDYC